MSINTAPTELNAGRPVEHMTQKDWDNLVEQRRRKFERAISEKKRAGLLGRFLSRFSDNFQVYTAPSLKTVAEEIPNRDPINIMDWVIILVGIIGFIFTSIKAAAAAVPYSEGVLYAMLHTEGMTKAQALATVNPDIRTAFAWITAAFFIALLTPAVIFFKIVDHTAHTKAQKAATAIVIDRWPENLREWIVLPFYALYRMLSLEWLTPRLPMVITYASIFWLIHINITGGGNVFEMAIPIFVEVALAQSIAAILEKTANYRALVLDAWEQRMKRWKYRRQNYMADQTFLEGLFADIREKLIAVSKQGTRPNAWLEHADAQVIDNAVLYEFRRFTGGQVFAERVKELDYTKALVQGEERVPPNGAAAWTPDTLFIDLQQRGVQGEYNESKLDADYGSKYKARAAWRGGAKQKYLATT